MMETKLFIATIGGNFQPDCWEALQRAAQATASIGVQSQIVPIGNRCVTPMHGLAMMRNLGIIDAIRTGATHVMLIDTDIQLAENALVELLQARTKAAVPWFDQGAISTKHGWHHLIAPPDTAPPGTAPRKLDWAIMSCVLFETAVFGPAKVEIRLFRDYMATMEEEYYWAYLSLFGIDCWQIPTAIATLRQPPTKMYELDKQRIVPHPDGNGRIELILEQV